MKFFFFFFLPSFWCFSFNFDLKNLLILFFIYLKTINLSICLKETFKIDKIILFFINDDHLKLIILP